jgi:hypothetical protein
MHNARTARMGTALMQGLLHLADSNWLTSWADDTVLGPDVSLHR